MGTRIRYNPNYTPPPTEIGSGGTTDPVEAPPGGTTESPPETSGGTTDPVEASSGGTTESPPETSGGTTETPVASWEFKEKLPIQDQMEHVIKLAIQATQCEVAVLRRKIEKLHYGS